MVCRPSVLYSGNLNPSAGDVANDLSKCSLKEVERSRVDRPCAIPMTRLPLQVTESIQGTMFETEDFFVHFHVTSRFSLLVMHTTCNDY